MCLKNDMKNLLYVISVKSNENKICLIPYNFVIKKHNNINI